MDKTTEAKKKQLKTILNLLEKSKVSEEGYESSDKPFFMKGVPSDFKINHKPIPDLPESLNRHFKMFYQVVGDPDREVYIGDWTIMSLNEALKQYKDYCSKGQTNVFNIGYKYAGMGHIEVLSCNLYNHLLFKRGDGGSSGWDREYNYKKILNFDYKEYEYFYFNEWYNNLNI
jgi:hypothetical protein